MTEEQRPVAVPRQTDRRRDHCTADAWLELTAHVPRLLALARRSGCDEHDAWDVTQEALLRAATTAELDPARVRGLLTVIVRRLVVDLHRVRQQDARLAEQRGLDGGPHPDHQDHVCEQAEARWLRDRTDALPGRQRQALLARAAGHGPERIAADMQVSVKAVELVTRRARLALRTALTAGLALLLLSTTGSLPAPGPAGQGRAGRPIPVTTGGTTRGTTTNSNTPS